MLEVDITEMSIGEAVAILVMKFGEGAATARWLVAFAKGETDGDAAPAHSRPWCAPTPCGLVR